MRMHQQVALLCHTVSKAEPNCQSELPQVDPEAQLLSTHQG